jgi:hypothetical protein
MTRNKLARSSSAAQERVLRVLPLLPRTVLVPTFLSAWSAHYLGAQDTATARQWYPCAAAAHGCADHLLGRAPPRLLLQSVATFHLTP